MQCPTCSTEHPSLLGPLADRIQALRTAGWNVVEGVGLCCRSCVSEAAMRKPGAHAPDASDDATRAAFVAARGTL